MRHWLLQRARQLPELGRRFVERRPDGRLEPRVNARLIDHLVRQPLPTNVRELHGLLLRAVEASDGEEIRLPATEATSTRPPPTAGVEARAPAARRASLVERFARLKDHFDSFAASRLTCSIFGGSERSSPALAMSAAAIGPFK